MSLQTFEQAIRQLYASPGSQTALTSSENLTAFLKTLPLSDHEQENFLVQPFDRLGQYQFMLFANAQDTLEAIFPLTYTVLGDGWEALTRDYFYNHPCDSFQITDYGIGFADYLATQANILSQYPFLAELAAYEWLQADLENAVNPVYPTNKVKTVPTNPTDLARWAPLLNENAMFRAMSYPIPQIITAIQAEADVNKDKHVDWATKLSIYTPRPTFLWVFRAPQSPFPCRYFELNAPLATWLTTAWENRLQKPSYSDILAVMVDALQSAMPQAPDYETCATEFIPVLKQLLDLKILLGSIPL